MVLGSIQRVPDYPRVFCPIIILRCVETGVVLGGCIMGVTPVDMFYRVVSGWKLG